MSADIVPFTFEEVNIRTLVLDGEPWFVAVDIARALDIQNPRMAVARIPEDDVSLTDVTDSLGRAQQTYVVNEAGLYDLIFRSDKPEAKKFRAWVTREVLPEIRRSGTFGHPADDLALPTDYLTALKALVQREEQNLVLEQENAELTPRAIAWDAIASAEGDYSVGEAAKMLSHAGVPNMGPQRLFSRLAEIGWTFRDGLGTWQAKADRVEKGFLSTRPQFHHHPRTGQRVVDPPQLRVTLKGVEQLRRRLGGGTGAIRAVAS